MANTYLTKTNSGGGSETKGTFSAWIKISELGDDNVIFHELESSGNYFSIKLKSGDFLVEAQNNSSAFINVRTDAIHRDASGWYNFVVAIDSTQATASDRIKMYVNGVLQTSFSTATYPPQNQNCKINQNNEVQTVGGAGATEYFSGSMSHIHWVDGTAYAASTFGSTDSTTGEWQINTSPTLTYGTNGFFILKNGNSLTDESGNSNNFTLGGGTLTKTEDCPSNVFATLNPLARDHGDQDSSLTQGNNTYELTSYRFNTKSSLGMTKGKFYWEQLVNNATAAKVGLCTSQFNSDLDTDDSDAYYGSSIGFGGVYLLMSNSTTNWQRTNNDTSRNIDTYTNAIASGSSSILMGAVDVDAGKLWVGVDGVWMYSGNPATGANAQIDFTNSTPDPLHVFAGNGDTGNRICKYNFGNGYFGTTVVSSAGTNASGIGIFEYDVPAGFTAISTKGLNL